MAKKLKPEILKFLSEKFKRTSEKIRPRLSEIRRDHSGLTLNAAAQFYAQQNNISIMSKLDDEDRNSLASIQTISQVNSSKTIKIDKRTLNINNSPIHNLSFGDRSTVNQSVVNLDSLLTELFEKIDKTKDLPIEEKNDYKSDVQSLASQIGKNKPSRQIIQTAWESIKRLADIEGFAQLITRIAPIIKILLSAHGVHTG